MSEQMRQYWQERFKQMEEAQHDTSVQKVQEIQEQFEKAQAAIEGKIDAWYQRISDFITTDTTGIVRSNGYNGNGVDSRGNQRTTGNDTEGCCEKQSA